MIKSTGVLGLLVLLLLVQAAPPRKFDEGKAGEWVDIKRDVPTAVLHSELMIYSSSILTGSEYL
jgi:hypothetical protein